MPWVLMAWRLTKAGGYDGVLDFCIAGETVRHVSTKKANGDAHTHENSTTCQIDCLRLRQFIVEKELPIMIVMSRTVVPRGFSNSESIEGAYPKPPSGGMT